MHPVVLFFAMVATVCANTVTYEGDVFPEEVGWERVGTLDADRSLDGGLFVQFLQLGVWAPEPFGEADFYRRSLKDFAGAAVFFIEWRVETDAPSSILDVSATPVALSAGGSAAANYQMKITDTKVQLWRSNFLPILLLDITGGVPHTYRLELHTDQWYAWYIDGELVDAGTPEGPYPNNDSVVIWGARHHYVDNTTRWDYVRFGTIEPEPIPTVSQWGVVIMALFFITTGAIVLKRRRVAKA